MKLFQLFKLTSIALAVLLQGDYYEAICKQVDSEKKEMVCCFPADAGLDEACFKISYDALIVSVGSVNNTFGVKGVDEYCSYFKSIEDANSLRARVSECFERAALPATPDEVRATLPCGVQCKYSPVTAAALACRSCADHGCALVNPVVRVAAGKLQAPSLCRRNGAQLPLNARAQDAYP